MCSSIKRLTSKVLLVLSVWNVKPYTYLKRKKVRRTVRVELEPCVNKVTGPSPECSDFARVRFLARCTDDDEDGNLCHSRTNTTISELNLFLLLLR